MNTYQHKNKARLKRLIKAGNIYRGLKYPTREINRTFKIKVSGVNSENGRVHKLVGVSGLLHLVDVKLANSLLKKAFESKEDKTVCKLRRGLKITFYFY